MCSLLLRTTLLAICRSSCKVMETEVAFFKMSLLPGEVGTLPLTCCVPGRHHLPWRRQQWERLTGACAADAPGELSTRSSEAYRELDQPGLITVHVSSPRTSMTPPPTHTAAGKVFKSAATAEQGRSRFECC